MEKLEKNYYDLLNITRDADPDAIKKGYRKAALEHHPDKGGTDQMFQLIKEAYDTLSDPIRKRNYDRDLKKYNLKDGLKKTKSTMDAGFTKPAFKKGNTATNFGTEEPKMTKKSASESTNKKPPTVEIPSDLKSLSIKELKNLLKALDINYDDCFEKQDMINRLKEHQNSKTGGGKTFTRSTTEAPPRPPSSSAGPKRSTTQTNAASGSCAGSMGAEEPVAFKILSVGNQEVGKSCLIKRYCEGRFVKRYISTIGIDYGVKKMSLDGAQISINFFDLSGNDDYKLIREEFYADTDGVLMVYDVDNRDSYVNLVHWEAEMRQNGIDPNEVQIIVCANKVDGKGREVSAAEGQKWCKMRGYTYFETSANTGSKVTEAFESLFVKVLDKFRANQKQFGVS